MKRILSVIIICVMLVCLLAACGKGKALNETVPSKISTPDAPAVQQPSGESQENTDNEPLMVNYKGIKSCTATLDDVTAVEGREPDFFFDVNDATIYAYNNVTLGSITFAQVQVSFSGDYIRFSCTDSTGEENIFDQWRDEMTSQYGEPSGNETSLSWRVEGSNYVMLSRLNDTTIQLAFYIYEN